MLRIAIVEDELAQAQLLESYLKRHGERAGVAYVIQIFTSAADFVETYRSTCDVVFLDIDMPLLNGMDAAHEIRAQDPSVCIVFVTNLSQYAVEGYEVNAFGFLVKPLTYPGFCACMDRVVEHCHRQQAHESIVLNKSGGFMRLELANIIYIEVREHDLRYITTSDTHIEHRVTLHEREEELADHHFARANNYTLVNLAHVVSFKGAMLTLTGGHVVELSRGRRHACLTALADYMGSVL